MRGSRLSKFGWLPCLLGVVAACGGKNVPGEPTAPVEAASLETVVETEDASESLRTALKNAEDENARLRGSLSDRTADLTALEETNATLELELSIALEELIRSRANLKNVQSRAFAVSRIAEVRVELESLRVAKEPTLNDRLERAENFLERADQALVQDVWGGAAFLAERAGELVRQAKTMAEIRKREATEILPIVPPRELAVRAPANLRNGPSAGAERVGAVEAGAKLEAIGRLGEWYQVKTSDGRKVWIHRSLVG